MLVSSGVMACVRVVKVTLTKNLRGRLVFLDDHVSSSGGNEKHLKEAFAKCAGGGGSRGAMLGEDETERRQVR